jgi:WD40 repeat protein
MRTAISICFFLGYILISIAVFFPIRQEEDFITAIDVSPNRTMIATGSLHGVLKIIDASSLQEIVTLQTSGDFITDIKWSRDGEWLATSNYHGFMQVWDIASNTLVFEVDIAGRINGIFIGVTWSTDSVFVAGFTREQGTHIINAANGETVSSFQPGETYDSVWLPDTPNIISATILGIKFFDFSNGNLLQAIPLTPGMLAMTQIALSNNEHNLAIFNTWFDEATGGNTTRDTITIYSGDDLQYVTSLNLTASNVIMELSWSPDDEYIAASGYDGLVHVWEVVTGRLVIVLDVNHRLYDVDWLSNTSLVYASLEGNLVTLEIPIDFNESSSES